MSADAVALSLVALADLAFIAHLRKWRNRRERAERMMRSLRLAIRRETSAAAAEPVRRLLRRAS